MQQVLSGYFADLQVVLQQIQAADLCLLVFAWINDQRLLKKENTSKYDAILFGRQNNASNINYSLCNLHT